VRRSIGDATQLEVPFVVYQVTWLSVLSAHIYWLAAHIPVLTSYRISLPPLPLLSVSPLLTLISISLFIWPTSSPCLAILSYIYGHHSLPLATYTIIGSKMFIGGLNWDTTDEGLRDYFSQFGKVDACTIMRDPSGTSRGFAFLTFEDPSAVALVTAQAHVLDGKSIDPKRAIPREEHLRNTRYFVGGLSPATTSDSMKEFFSTYGKVVDATVMVDRESGRSKGFGFVTYEDASNADQLVGKIGLILDDKQIEVKMAQPRSQRDQARLIGNANTNGAREPFFNDRESRTSTFIPLQQNQLPVISRGIGQGGMLGGMPGMMNMNMNPMAMAMMNGLTPMTGMGMMGPGMNGMNGMIGNMGSMGSMAGMGNMGGGLRLGMGPMGGPMLGMGGLAGNAMGMGIRSGMPINSHPGRAMNASGPGPARTNTRGQHNFHPYAR